MANTKPRGTGSPTPGHGSPRVVIGEDSTSGSWIARSQAGGPRSRCRNRAHLQETISERHTNSWWIDKSKSGWRANTGGARAVTPRIQATAAGQGVAGKGARRPGLHPNVSAEGTNRFQGRTTNSRSTAVMTSASLTAKASSSTSTGCSDRSPATRKA